MTIYAAPGTKDANVTFKPRYENWIGGGWVKPVKGQYFENISPVTGKAFTEVARGTAETSNSRSTPPTRRHPPGARRARPNAQRS